jgi:hypothetical protein
MSEIDAKSFLDEIIADPELKEQFKMLVLERINVMPDTLRVTVGSSDFGKRDIMQHVQEESEIGKQMMELDLEFMKALASGTVYRNE